MSDGAKSSTSPKCRTCNVHIIAFISQLSILVKRFSSLILVCLTRPTFFSFFFSPPLQGVPEEPFLYSGQDRCSCASCLLSIKYWLPLADFQFSHIPLSHVLMVVGTNIFWLGIWEMRFDVASADTRYSCGPEFQIVLIVYQWIGSFSLCRLSVPESIFALLWCSCPDWQLAFRPE